MLKIVQDKVPVYLIDEAQRLQSVSNVDTFAIWDAALRELTELTKVGMLFFVAHLREMNCHYYCSMKSRRRIGVVNYVEFQNPGRDQLRDFLLELFATSIQKGKVPTELRGTLNESALSSIVPDELLAITASDPEGLLRTRSLRRPLRSSWNRSLYW